MKLMLVLNWDRSSLKEIGGKFASGVDVDVPEGVTLLGRWHDPASRMAWMVVETSDLVILQTWMARWSDFLDWETYTVMDDEEVGQVLQNVL